MNTIIQSDIGLQKCTNARFSSLTFILTGFTLLVTISLIFLSPAQAGGLYKPKAKAPFLAPDELRLGIFLHNAEDFDDDNDESGIDINVELLLGRPNFQFRNSYLQHFLTPRPHIGGQVNTEGDTSQFYFGVTWDVDLTEDLFFETSFGGAVHDGPLDEAGVRSFGCSLNFRESASLGYRVTENWSALLTIEHMSNADICDRNGGLTNVGGRLGYKLQ